MGRFLGRILLPQGYPHTVAPNYLQYTRMRGLQYFFGGAIGVFSTRSLLSALGVTGRSKGRYDYCSPSICAHVSCSKGPWPPKMGHRLKAWLQTPSP